jgi:hypothetical protein
MRVPIPSRDSDRVRTRGGGTSPPDTSSTVKDLVAGSGIAFRERGTHELKGIPGEWRLYAVARQG